MTNSKLLLLLTAVLGGSTPTLKWWILAPILRLLKSVEPKSPGPRSFPPELPPVLPILKGGYQKMYVQHVTQASEGADLDFLIGCRGTVVTRESH